VLLRTRTLDANMQETLWTLVPVFVVGLLLIVLLGRLLASWIDRPLAELVSASNRVAQGNLEVQVSSNRRDELGLLARRFNEMVGGLRQLLIVKELFGRFVSPEVSDKLLTGQIELGGEQREVTVLFSDMRNFTHLSEEYPAPAIVDLLNEYFRAVVRAAREHGGTVNKFGGDSTLIVFGAPLDMPDQADRALATALAMRKALKKINAHRTKEGWEPISQGIGINTGSVVAGQVGSEDRMEYTVIGYAVNLASRLEQMTKTVPGADIFFSDSTLTALTNPRAWNYLEQSQIEMTDKQGRIRIYSLTGNQSHGEAAPRPARRGEGASDKQLIIAER
jgi:adenylate cyclase